MAHPGIIEALGSSTPTGERGSWERIERPAFRAQVPLRRSRSVEGSLTLASVEAGNVAARQGHPRPALTVDVKPTHPESGLRYLVDLRQGSLRRIRSRIQPQDVPRE